MKSDIEQIVMETFSNVQNVEVYEVEAAPGNVIITVTTDLLDPLSQYGLKVDIMAVLAPLRPAGVGYEVILKRFDDGSIITLGRASEIQVFNTAQEVMEAFGAPSEGYANARRVFELDENEEPMLPRTRQNRFQAVAAEITEHIKPLMKRSPSESTRPTAPQLFEQTIVVVEGKPSACPKCSLFAFEPNASGGRVTCRGCPVPAPSFAVESKDNFGLNTRQYRCVECRRDSWVTMELREVNLYCAACGILTLHDLMWKSETLLDRPTKTKRVVGRDIKFTFKDAVVGKITNVSFDEEVAKDPEDVLVTRDWKSTINAMVQRAARTVPVPPELLQPDEELTAETNLVSLFVPKLGLQPFAKYAAEQREKNIKMAPELPPDSRNPLRGTGRTTRGILYAIAKVLCSNKVSILCVVAHTQIYTRDLTIQAFRLYEKLDLQRRIDIRPLMPDDFDPTYDYEDRSRAHVYIDHTYVERAFKL